MSGYFITICRDRAVDEASSQTRIHVDLSSGQPRVTQVLVTAGSEEGLEPSDLPPNIDLSLLVQAFGGLPFTTSAGMAPADVRPIQNRRHRSRTVSGRAPSGPLLEDKGAAHPQNGSGTGEAARSYRKMPAPEEVLAVYGQTGTITALAAHFGVPRHTAQGWAGRLRQQGFRIGRE